jgi:hypothetical protein
VPALVVTLFAVSGCSRHQLPTTVIRVKDVPMRVEVADDGEERSRGLMFRDSLGADEGMLFVYPVEAPRSFWMKDTRIPLSIAYLASDGTIVSMADMRPMSERGTPSDQPAMYALEVNQGWFGKRGIAVGDRVQDLPGPSEH